MRISCAKKGATLDNDFSSFVNLDIDLAQIPYDVQTIHCSVLSINDIFLGIVSINNFITIYHNSCNPCIKQFCTKKACK